LAAILALLVIFPGPSSGSLVEKIVVVVNGVPHTFSDMRKFARDRLNRDVKLDELAAGRVPKQWVEEFITYELIRTEVRNTRIRVRDAYIDSFIRAVRERYALSPAQLDALLIRAGQTPAQYRDEGRCRI